MIYISNGDNMKKTSITKKRKKMKLLFTFSMLILGIIASYKTLDNKKIVINDKELTNLIINDSFNNNEVNFIKEIVSDIASVTNPIRLLKNNYETETKRVNKDVKEEYKPTIYLYNSHQSEEYASQTLAEYSVTPTVIMNNYILEDIFNKNNYKTVVEDASIKEILNKNNWKYYNSYKASRVLLEESIIKYPTLKYFIDIHRDSLPHNRTTVEIDNKQYAKVLFLIGLENENYEKNLEFTEKINNKLNEYYSGLSKGILKKGGAGVNGVYNQDFSDRTILIEIGGYENTPTEVLNSTIAFSKCFLEVLNEENN